MILWKYRRLLHKCLTHFLTVASGTDRSPGLDEGPSTHCSDMGIEPPSHCLRHYP